MLRAKGGESFKVVGEIQGPLTGRPGLSGRNGLSSGREEDLLLSGDGFTAEAQVQVQVH